MEGEEVLLLSVVEVVDWLELHGGWQVLGEGRIVIVLCCVVVASV